MSRAVAAAQRLSVSLPIGRGLKDLFLAGALRSAVDCEVPMSTAALPARRQVSAPGFSGLRAEYLMEGG